MADLTKKGSKLSSNSRGYDFMYKKILIILALVFLVVVAQGDDSNQEIIDMAKTVINSSSGTAKAGQNEITATGPEIFLIASTNNSSGAKLKANALAKVMLNVTKAYPGRFALITVMINDLDGRLLATENLEVGGGVMRFNFSVPQANATNILQMKPMNPTPNRPVPAPTPTLTFPHNVLPTPTLTTRPFQPRPLDPYGRNYAQ